MVVSDTGPFHIVFDNSLPNGVKGILTGFSDADSARSLQRTVARTALRASIARQREETGD